jgi:protein-tyrosine-phosphatase
MTRPISVLFLCTHNSARSILAEALLNELGAGRFAAYSAGSTPRASGTPNPLALRVLADEGIDTTGLRSKSWDAFLGADAPPIDLVITVCGNANEACPVVPGRPATAHWGYDDPSAGDAPDEVKLLAFRSTVHQLRRRLLAFVSLPSAALQRMALEQSARHLAGT